MLGHQRLMMQRSCTIDVAGDASALLDIDPLSFSSAEFADTFEAWLEEHFMDITDDGDIPKACLEENLMATMDDGDIPEAKVIEHFMYGVNGDIVPLLNASFLDQVVLVPTQQPFKDSSTRKVNRVLLESRYKRIYATTLFTYEAKTIQFLETFDYSLLI